MNHCYCERYFPSLSFVSFSSIESLSVCCEVLWPNWFVWSKNFSCVCCPTRKMGMNLRLQRVFALGFWCKVISETPTGFPTVGSLQIRKNRQSHRGQRVERNMANLRSSFHLVTVTTTPNTRPCGRQDTIFS